MMISIKELNLSELDSLVEEFFKQEDIEQLSRETGFTQRIRKLTGSIFLYLVIFNSESLKKQSLNDISIDLKDKYNIDIKKQSLQEKFNEKALFFLRAILEGLINKQIEVDRLTQKYNKFKRIMIKDSVCFQISETLKEYYPGSGGSGSKASIRIQFEYDILSCKINDLSVKAFNKQDSIDAIETINLIRKGDLIVRDLAYMHNKALELIDKTKAFKTLVKKIEEMRKVFVLGTHSLESFMKKFYELSITNYLLEKRKKEPTSMDLLLGCLNV